MKPWIKAILIAAVVCVVAGGLISAGALWDLKRSAYGDSGSAQSGGAPNTGITDLGSTELGTDGLGITSHTYTPEQTFTRLQINVVSSHVTLLPAGDGPCRVEYTQYASHPVTVAVEGDTLRITQKWGWSFDMLALQRTDVVVYLDQAQYEAASVVATSGSLELQAGLTFGTLRGETTSGRITCNASAQRELELDSTSGRITAENLTAGSFSAETTSGAIELSALTIDRELELDSGSGRITADAITCGSAELETTSGGIELTDLVSRGSLDAETASGGLHLTRCDAADLSLETVSGTVRGSLLTPKVFRTETVSGTIRVPDSGSGGVCHIETVSGSVTITLEPNS